MVTGIFKGAGFSFVLPLRTYGTSDWRGAPTIEAGDFQISKEGGAFANLATLPAETPANGKGVLITLSNTEANANYFVIRGVDQTTNKEWEDTGESFITTTNVAQTGDSYPIVSHASYGNAQLVRSTTPANTLKVDAAGLADANTVKLGPTGAGVAQTGRDIGLSVLISSGTGTGQLDVTSGVIKANATQILGTAVSTPATAGILDVNLKNIANAAVSVTTAQLGVNVVNNAGSAITSAAGIQEVKVASIATDALSAAATSAAAVTKIQAGLATPTNITAGVITTVTNLTNAPTAGDLTATMKTSVTTAATASTPTAASVTGSVGSIAAGGIASSSFAAGAIDATAIATDAIGSAEISAAAVTKIQAGLATPTNITSASGVSLAADQAVNATKLAGQTITAAAGVTFPTSVASPTNITAGTITTVTNLTNAPTAGDLTATMKTSVTTAATAATPIAASVTGSVGSVVGAVGSVTGAVGSVTGAVGSVAAGGITAASIAADAITAAKIADGAIDSATFAADTGLQSVRSNTAQAGGNTSVTLDAAASATTDFYAGTWITLTGGTGSGQTRLCTAYNGGTKVATVAPAWATNPDNTSTFSVGREAQVAGVQGNVTGSVGSVTGAVGSVTGAVGSVTGNVGGNVVGSVASVTGAVGSVTGAAGSVTGSVGSIATGGIAAASFAAGAIDAAAIATDAIGSAELAASAVTKIQAGLATPTNITAGTITTVTNLTNAPTAGDLTATMKTSVTTAATAATPTAAAVTAAVTVGTNNDKTGYSLTSLESFLLQSGTAQAGAGSTITLAAGASATDSLYVGAVVKVYGGTGAGQVRVITGYVGATKVATVDRAWATNPDNTSTYAVLAVEAPKSDASLQVTAASVTGSVASVTGAVGSLTTNNDKTGYALSGAGVTAVQSGLATPTNITAGTITTVTNLTNAATSGDLTATMKTSVTTAATAATPTVTLAAAAVQAIWDALTSALTTVGSIGKLLVTNIDATVTSRTKPADTQAAVTLVATTTAVTNDVGITQAGADKAWSTATRALTDKAAFSLAADQSGVTIGTVNAIATAGMLAIWHVLLSTIATAGSVGKLIKDYLDAAITSRATPAQVNTEADTALSDIGATLTRLTYLDKLNITGNVASSSEVTAIQNNTSVRLSVPGIVERPDSGTQLYIVDVYLYDENGNMEAPDSAPTVTLIDQGGTDYSVRLDSATGALINVGHYRWQYTATYTDELEQLRWEFDVVEGGQTRKYGTVSLIVDTSYVDFTAADRAKLDTLHDTRLTAARALALDNLDATITSRTKPADTQAAVTLVINDVGITQAGADKVWSTTTRALTDKIGFALSVAGVQAVWDALTSALTTVGSVGKLLVTNVDTLISSRLSPTVAGRTLDVTTTGEAGLDFDNIKQATGATTLTNIRIPVVTLADTLTTYTGNTPQTGDAFARLGAPVGASVSADVAAVKSDSAAIKTKTDFLPSAAAGAAGGVFIAGTNAPVIIIGSGTALTLTSTGANGHGLTASGNGSGDGLSATGGATGHGLELVGGATSGNGFKASGTAGNSAAMNLVGQGSAAGLLTTGGATGHGINAVGGVTSGSGLVALGGGTGHGISATSGSGATGNGLSAVAVSTNGNGFAATGTGTGNGLLATGGSSAGGDGIEAVAGGGVPIRGDLTSNITGNLSGSVGSVTGAVGSVTGNVTGSVGSVTGNVGGDLIGDVQKKVLGGGASSITGTGVQAQLPTGAVSAATFAAGAINAAVIADAAIDNATFAIDTGKQTIRSNTAQAGGNTSITLDASASATNDYYKDAWIFITSAAGVGQARLITAYNGSTKMATIAPAWATNPDVTSTFAVILAAQISAIAGAVDSVTGAVGSVTGNIGGSVASVTGAVGSVTGSVGSIASGGIAAASFAAGAIDATAIATDAIGSAEIAASAVTKIQAGLATPTNITAGTITTVTGNVGGNVVGSVGSVIAAVTVGTNNDKTGYSLTSLESFLLQSGTAQAGAGSTITLAAGASATDDLYKGTLVKVYGGTGVGQVRVIISYVGSSKVATVDRAWATNPDNTSTYAVLAIESPKIDTSLQVTAASVQGNVTGSVASVAGDIGGNVVGTVASVVGNVGGNVSGSVASVAGNVGGSVAGSVGSVATGGITAASIAAAAITAAKFATDAIDTNALATSAVTEIQSGLATSGAVSAIQADTDDIQARLPAALIGGRMDSNVGAISGDAVAADNLEAASDGTGFNLGAGTIVAASVTGNVGGDLIGDVRKKILGGGASAITGVGTRSDVREWIGSTPNVLISGRVDANAQVVGDKTDYSLSAAGVQAVWDALSSALTTVGSIGKRLVDFVTGDTFGRMGSPAGASMSADVAAVKSDSTGIKAKTDQLVFTAANKVDASVRDWKGSIPNDLISGRVDVSAQVVGDKTGYTLTAAERDNIVKAGSGTATSTSSTSITDTGRSEATDYWANMLIFMTSGVTAGQLRRIDSFDGTTKTFVVDIPFVNTPGVGDTYIVIRTAYAPSTGGGDGSADWTTSERQQIRDALGVDGSKADAIGGQLQQIKDLAALIPAAL